MADGPLREVMRHIHQLASAASTDGVTDRQLLDRFARRRDEDAFATLVERHGPLVLRVCRRVLGHEQDAEDAFQATFHVLARRAGGVGWQESVANWLYEVAWRVAHKARGSAARRHVHERQANLAETPATPQRAWDELKGLLDEELARLPRKFREPLVLCYLEGKSRDEAAQELGWSLGMVKGRLERGRDRLRQRLEKRGLTLSAALFALALGESTVTAVPPATLATITVQTCVTGTAPIPVNLLAQGVLRAMLRTRIQTALAIGLAVLALGYGLARATMPAPDTIPPAASPSALLPPAEEPDNPARDGTLQIAFVKEILLPNKQPVPGKPPSVPENWLMDPDGRNARAMPSWPGDRYPVLSPDGCRLAMVKDQQVYTVGLDGKGEKQISRKPGTFANLTWSPDGKFLAYLVEGKVHLLNVATREVTQLPQDKVSGGLAISPDGKHLAFTRYVGEPSQHELYVASIMGLNEKQLTSAKTLSATDPMFSPDGKILFVGGHHDIEMFSVARRLYRIDVDGRNQQELYASTADMFWPALSPDGKKVVYATGGPHVFSLIVLDIASGRETKLGNGLHPRWVMIPARGKE
jgi:RNA polymerase sigma factor (sigma-70 family)